MIKISENVDLSKKVLEIDIQSPIFQVMLQDLDNEIARVIDKVYKGEFEGGEINLKLGLTIEDGYKEFPRENEHGETVYDTYKYKKPNFEHNVTTTLKKQYKLKGNYTEEKEVVYEDGQYMVKPIEEPQLNLFEMEDKE